MAANKAPIQRSFNLEAGKEAGRLGMALASIKRRDILELARSLAIQIALEKDDRMVTADEVQARLEEEGIPADSLGNAAGSLFRRRPEWRCTGQWKPSSRVSAHARAVRAWMYVGRADRVSAHAQAVRARRFVLGTVSR